jgi:hypothetical protein
MFVTDCVSVEVWYEDGGEYASLGRIDVPLTADVSIDDVVRALKQLPPAPGGEQPGAASRRPEGRQAVVREGRPAPRREAPDISEAKRNRAAEAPATPQGRPQ